MLDSGLPLITEANILKELIKAPTMFRRVATMVTGDGTKWVEAKGFLAEDKTIEREREERFAKTSRSSSVSEVLPSNQLSNIPWRRLGVKYTNNEAYFDLIEEVDAIIDRHGTTIMCEIQGYVSRRREAERERVETPIDVVRPFVVVVVLHRLLFPS